ncbi:hypothetical protein [Halanaerobacter jeridensis]|uniref:Uncharacterized protein n=1 Tax=Halanaerobacter jeridensis TaxID=706427 RepID=A0A938XRB7_9FIRM|nr:hypothetical protein [Halanaerobacter jeridensis]MBM7556304.1 hypothetical protein [Halanaerobacter jeridensis]
MTTRIEKILQDDGPMVSGVLAKKLEEKHEITNDAARKAISRANSPVKKMKTISFNNNQQFIYLSDHFKTQLFYQNLVNSFETHAKAYHFFIQAVLFHDGFIDMNQLPSYTCSPIKKLKGHKPASSIIDDLLQLDVLVEYTDDIYQLNSLIEVSSTHTRFKAIELAKELTISNFEDWAKKINFTSYNDAEKLSNNAEFYKFQWGFTAPSYILNLRNEDSPGFIVADILLGKEVLEEHVEYFLNKIDIIKQNHNVSSFIPIIIVEDLEKEAFQLLKSRGIFIGFVNELFDNQYTEVLKSLVNVIENASAVISKNPDKYFDLFDKLSDLRGASINLRGALFELAVGYYYSQSSIYIKINEVVLDKDSGERREIDVLAYDNPDRLRIVECKGKKAPIGKGFAKKWVTDNIPKIRSWTFQEDEHRNKELIFELWSTGGFEKEAEDYLKERAQSTNKYQINYFSKEEIRNKAKEKGVKKLRKIIDNYFSSDI